MTTMNRTETRTAAYLLASATECAIERLDDDPTLDFESVTLDAAVAYGVNPSDVIESVESDRATKREEEAARDRKSA